MSPLVIILIIFVVGIVGWVILHMWVKRLKKKGYRY